MSKFRKKKSGEQQAINTASLPRIVEFPIESIEKDIFKILNSEDYKHAYADF